MGESWRRADAGEGVSILTLGSLLDWDGVCGFVGVRFACAGGSLSSSRVGPRSATIAWSGKDAEIAARVCGRVAMGELKVPNESPVSVRSVPVLSRFRSNRQSHLTLSPGGIPTAPNVSSGSLRSRDREGASHRKNHYIYTTYGKTDNRTTLHSPAAVQ